MKYQLAIFDMDGTILDTLEDLKNAVNAALVQNDCPERTLEEVRRFVGNGIRKLVERAVPEGSDAAFVDRVLADFTAYYEVHSMDRTRPYEGIPELLRSIREKGIRTAVVSNKIDPAVQDLCRRFFDGLFDIAVGERPGMARKPAPDSCMLVLETLQVEPTEAVYIGDSDVDLATARAAGLPEILVEWGFRDREELEPLGASCFAKDTAQLEALLLQE